MNIYVAGSSRELERAAAAMRAVETAGHAVAFDWCRQIMEVGFANPEATDDQRREWCEPGLRGVVHADLFWFLVPQQPTSGAWFEFGVWYRDLEDRHDGKTISSGPGRFGSLFTAYVDYHFETDEYAAAWLATQR